MGHYQHNFLSFSCLINEIMHVKKKVLYFYAKCYKNAIFYKPKDIYLDQLNIFDPRQIYPNVSLASYIDNDKIAIKAKALEKLKIEKRRLQIELEQLKNG